MGKVNKEKLYKFWAVCAVQGYIDLADRVLEQYKNEIYSVASALQRNLPPNSKKLYRGIILNPNNRDASGMLVSKVNAGFISFSENLDVAAWFASADSHMAEMLLLNVPNGEGFIIKYEPKRSEILFHYKWYHLLRIKNELSGIESSLIQMGLEPDLSQFIHNVTSQEEVILKPVTQKFNLIPKRELSDKSGEELDKMFLPEDILKQKNSEYEIVVYTKKEKNPFKLNRKNC